MSTRVDPIRKLWRTLLRIYYKIEKQILSDPRKLNVFKSIVCLLPLNPHKVVFNSFNGGGYGENPKYIAEELLKRKGKAKIVWIVNSNQYLFPKGVTPINKYSLRAYYEYATAKAWVLNARYYRLTEKRKSQIYLQTWHGGIAIKKIEKDAEEKLLESYVKSAKEDGRVTDGIIVDGQSNEEIFKSSFWLNPNCELLKYGQPRIDALLKNRDNTALNERVREALGIEKDSFFVLYAPTFRQSKSTLGYIYDYPTIKKALEKRFGKTSIAIRLHPVIATDKNITYDYIGIEDLIDATAYPDVQELVLSADCLISDYSSIIYDFALIRKPVFLLLKDHEEYVQERGVYDIFYKQPFNMNYSESSLVNDIEHFSQECMLERIDAFYKKYQTYNAGHSSELTVDWLLNKGLKN